MCLFYVARMSARKTKRAKTDQGATPPLTKAQMEKVEVVLRQRMADGATGKQMRRGVLVCHHGVDRYVRVCSHGATACTDRGCSLLDLKSQGFLKWTDGKERSGNGMPVKCALEAAAYQEDKIHLEDE